MPHRGFRSVVEGLAATKAVTDNTQLPTFGAPLPAWNARGSVLTSLGPSRGKHPDGTIY